MTTTSTIADRSSPEDVAAAQRALDDARSELERVAARAVETDTAGAWRTHDDARRNVERCEVRLRAAQAREDIATRRAAAQEQEDRRRRFNTLTAELGAAALEKLKAEWTADWRAYIERGAALHEEHSRRLSSLVGRYPEHVALAGELGVSVPDARAIYRVSHAARYDAGEQTRGTFKTRDAGEAWSSIHRALRDF